MNRRRRITAIAVSALAAGAGMTLPARADALNIVYVDSSVLCNPHSTGSAGDPFCSIPAALTSDSVTSGTTLSLSGQFQGGIDITKSGITLLGEGSTAIVGGAYGMSVTGQHDVRLDGIVFVEQTGSGVRIDASQGVTVSGGMVQKAGGTGVVVQNSSDVTVANAIVAANGDGGIRIAGTTTADVVANTVDENCGTGIAVQGASTDVSIANNIDGWARTCGAATAVALAVNTTAATPVIDSNIFTTAVTGAPAIQWQGQAIATGQALDAAGHGTGDLSTPSDFLYGIKSDYTRDDYTPSLNSPAIDSADSAARRQPTLDGAQMKRTDDLAVADTGTGDPAYADRGAREVVRQNGAPDIFFSFTQGQGPADYRTITAQFSTWQDSWWPVTSYTIDWGDHSSTDPAPYSSGTASASHTYATDGNYSGSLTAVDSAGHQFTRPLNVNVAPHVFTPTMTTAVTTGNPDWPGSVEVTLWATNSDPLATYRIDYGDGSEPDVNPGFLSTTRCQTRHSYKAGTYQITATVADANGWGKVLKEQVTINPFPGPVPRTPPIVHRIGGTDRYDTARKVSQAQWKPGSASAVVLARGDQAPDALSGVPLAAHVHGPLLLTDPAALDAATRAEIDRATGGPSPSKTVYILGGEKAVSPSVEARLRKAGYTVVRCQGSDRFGTSLAVAAAFGKTEHVIVATGRDFPDALAAGPLGTVENAPIVLSDGDALTPQVAAFVTAHKAVDPVGGAAQRAVAKLPAAGGRVVNTLLSGPTRYDTAVAVARAVTQVTGHAPTGVGVASGVSFPDALTGGAYAANAGMPLLITEPYSLSEATRFWLTQWVNLLPTVTVFGGPAAVSDNVMTAMAGAVNGKVQ